MSFRKYHDLFINPRPVFKAMPPPTQVFMRIFNAIKKRFLYILIVTILTLFIVRILMSEGAFSIYDDFGITSSKQPTGWLWDILWWIRGQPAGWQVPKATGLFAVRKTIAGPDHLGRGFNGPLNVIALLFEFIVDFMFYLPNFLNPGFVAVNLDLVPPMIIKMIIDVGAQMVLHKMRVLLK